MTTQRMTSAADLAKPAPSPLQFDSCYQLLANQIFHQPGEAAPCKSIMIIGAAREVGSTTAATGLADYLSGTIMQRVLIIDANFANPCLHKIHGIPQKPGFAEYLAGQGQGDSMFFHASSTLSVLPCGDTALLPRTLLSFDPGCWERFKQLSLDYDLVILDAAPTSVCPESFPLASKTDGVIVVAKAEKTRKEVLRATMLQLRTAGARVRGGILNRRRFHIPAWLYRHLS